MILTPDMVEKGAKAIFQAMQSKFNIDVAWEDLPEFDKEAYLVNAFAALFAVIPEWDSKAFAGWIHNDKIGNL